MAAKKKPTAKQLAARKKFAAAAKARSKAAKGKKRNTTIIKAKRIEHLDVSKIHSLGKVKNPRKKKKGDVWVEVRGTSVGNKYIVKQAQYDGDFIGAEHYDSRDKQQAEWTAKMLRRKTRRRKPNITSASDLAYAGTAKRATQDGVKGWQLGSKFFPGSATTKAVKVTSSAFLDLRTGDVWKRKAKGNPKKKRNIAGFKDADGNFHPIRSGTEQRTIKGRKTSIRRERF